MTRIVPVLISILALCGTATAAEGPQSLFERCFARTYDEAHLARHPKQEVTAITIWLTELEEDLAAVITVSVRGSAKHYTASGYCFRPIKGGYSCDGCEGDSCEASGERFALTVHDRDHIDLVNAETGISTAAYDPDEDTFDVFVLSPRGEHGVFALAAAPNAACGQ